MEILISSSVKQKQSRTITEDCGEDYVRQSPVSLSTVPGVLSEVREESFRVALGSGKNKALQQAVCSKARQPRQKKKIKKFQG